MRSHLKNIRRGAAVLATAFMLTGVSPNFAAFAQTVPPAPIAAALPESTVKALQEALNKQGIVVKVDGVLNEETRAAIRRYQSQHHLPVTGEPEQATLDKLGVRLSAAPADPRQPPRPRPQLRRPKVRRRRRRLATLLENVGRNDERPDDARDDADDAGNDGDDAGADAARLDAAGTHARAIAARRHDDELPDDARCKPRGCTGDDADDADDARHDADDAGDARPDAPRTSAARADAARADAARPHARRPDAAGAKLKPTGRPSGRTLHEPACITTGGSASS